MKNNYIKRILPVLLGIALLLVGCEAGESGQSAKTEEKERGTKVEKEETEDINAYRLRDKDVLYADDDETSVVTMYLTVSRGNSSENTDHSWEEINTYSAYDYEAMGVAKYQVNGLLQVGTEEGPSPAEVGYGEDTPNATVNIRGQTSSRNPQKGYKIELKKNKGTWRGQRTINLNKHQTDGLRFRNKLAYDLMKGIPEIMSLRTQFVHLYVKDETAGGTAFEDYGLYTQVEQLNKTGLKAHGMDSNGQLYKINYFEFYRYEDAIKLEDDPEFDRAKFEKLIEIKGSNDHTKLIEMLEAVNDNAIPIGKVLDKYFDTENITYWMAYMMLTGNIDTQSRNVYIYSPQNSDKWYFIPWDNDSALKTTEFEINQFVDNGSWQIGISNYWGNVLFQRCLKSEDFRAELDAAVRGLKEYLSAERLTEMIESYKDTVKPYVYRMPDRMYAPLTEAEYDEIAAAVPGEVEANYRLYLDSLKKPMPFFIGVPSIQDGRLKLNWDVAYDFKAEDVTYTVEVAKDYLFNQVIYSKTDLTIPETDMEAPEPGQYFVRVRARNESGEVQDAFDYYVTDTGKNFSMKCFYVQADGTVGEDVYEE